VSKSGKVFLFQVEYIAEDFTGKGSPVRLEVEIELTAVVAVIAQVFGSAILASGGGCWRTHGERGMILF